ncbi:hypothetical protein FB451DRAFT_1180185 [Mycena latifolia]|nr:hypothetical protein FB451DRAFT_1180185 [Mycena latifolia]
MPRPRSSSTAFPVLTISQHQSSTTSLPSITSPNLGLRTSSAVPPGANATPPDVFLMRRIGSLDFSDYPAPRASLPNDLSMSLPIFTGGSGGIGLARLRERVARKSYASVTQGEGGSTFVVARCRKTMSLRPCNATCTRSHGLICSISFVLNSTAGFETKMTAALPFPKGCCLKGSRSSTEPETASRCYFLLVFCHHQSATRTVATTSAFLAFALLGLVYSAHRLRIFPYFPWLFQVEPFSTINDSDPEYEIRPSLRIWLLRHGKDRA